MSEHDLTHNQSSNTVWHHATITREHREAQNNHKSVILWFTGLSGAGKSTLAHAVGDQLYKMGCHAFVLDGDNVRHGLCSDLGFSEHDRTENIRRVGHVAKLFLEAGIIVLTAFISPFKSNRQLVRNLVHPDEYLEIYCNAPVEVCEQRDVKGLYQKARQGLIKDFTGISSPYEAPTNPELIVNTGSEPLHTCASQVIQLLQSRTIISGV